MTHWPLLESFFAAVRLWVVSLPNNLKIALGIAALVRQSRHQLPLIPGPPVEQSVQECSNFLSTLKSHSHSFPFFLPSPQHYSPDAFESHLCSIARPCRSSQKPCCCFREKVFLHIRIRLRWLENTAWHFEMRFPWRWKHLPADLGTCVTTDQLLCLAGSGKQISPCGAEAISSVFLFLSQQSATE